jgi:acyl carrier protein phosphodiesterase
VSLPILDAQRSRPQAPPDVNFFGHAHFARRVSTAPRFVLGAMLPDLANMVGTRLRAQVEPEIAAGVRDHHQVDDVFHQAPTFVALSGEAYRELSARGLSWGSARAVAHVATELFLDGVLTAEPATAAAYQDAVTSAVTAETLAALSVADQDRERFGRLFERLASHGLPDRYRDPVFVRDVLRRVLEGRARLALTERDVPELDAYLPALRTRVESISTTLLGEVETGLAVEP